MFCHGIPHPKESFAGSLANFHFGTEQGAGHLKRRWVLNNLDWVLLWIFSPICWSWDEKGKVRFWDSSPSWWLDCCTSLLKMVVIFKFYLLYWVKKLPLWYQLYCRIPSSPTDCVQQQRSSRRFLREFADWLVEAAGWGLSFIINQLNVCYFFFSHLF